jgi:hypothetical protein
MFWLELERGGMELAGFIPQMINADDPRPVREQINANYAYGGGWQPMEGWTLDCSTTSIQYPGDPPYKLVAVGSMPDGTMIAIYPHAWVAIINPDDTFEVARMD